MTISLTTGFAGLDLPNPFILASAPPTATRAMIERAFAAGWGGAVIKTLAQKEDDALTNVRPRIRAVRARGRIIAFANMELGSMRVAEEWLDDIAALRRSFSDRVLIASLLYGGAPREIQWRRAARLCQEAGASALELNVSCPHGGAEEGGLSAIANRLDLLGEVIGWVRSATTLPLLIKLPMACDLAGAARAALAAGADAITAINTISALPGIDVETFTPAMAVDGRGAFGGLSGRAIKPIALRCVVQIGQACQLPICGVGGVYDWQDAAEFLLAGAGCVQVCSAVMEHGYGVIGDLTAGLSAWLERKNLPSVGAAVGLARPHIVSHRALSRARAQAVCDEDRCARCGACAVSCADSGYQAVAWTKGRPPSFDAARCDGCGLCREVCPTGSLKLAASAAP